jgi:hypothetical protein
MYAWSLGLVDACVVPNVILIFPPALKKCLILLALANVAETSCVADEFQPSEPVVTVCSADEVVSAVALGDPAATAVAKVARSVIKADLIAIVSPAETADAVTDAFVWLAMLSIPVNKAFQDEARIVSFAATVAISACPSPYCADPVPAKWL